MKGGGIVLLVSGAALVSSSFVFALLAGGRLYSGDFIESGLTQDVFWQIPLVFILGLIMVYVGWRYSIKEFRSEEAEKNG